MVADSVAGFIHRLLEKTKSEEVNWCLLSQYIKNDKQSKELNDYLFIANNEFNKIHIDSSYYFTYKRGYVVLLHETFESGKDNSVNDHQTLYVILNEKAPMMSLNDYFADGCEEKEMINQIYYDVTQYFNRDLQLPDDLQIFLSNCLPGR